MTKFKTLLYTFALAALTLTSCTDKGIFGEWRCNDFTIADTTGIPKTLVDNAVESAQGTVLIFHEDSTYQQDYIVEEQELISEIGHFTIQDNNLTLNPEKIGVKELSDNKAIEYNSIANSDFLTAIAKVSKYQIELKNDQLQLIDFIYGPSRNKNNKTTLFFERRE